MLDALADLCESDWLIFMTCGVVALAALAVVLIVVVVWPIDHVRIDDPLDHPFGDMPLPPHREEWR